MSISRRLRFEILRRDDHSCRYCGRRAPDVELTVDHVVPIALGGSDEPANLVAACKDCNSGKTSSSPDAPVVAAVSQDAMRWAAAIRQAAEEMERDTLRISEAVKAIQESWEAIDYWQRRPGPLPADGIRTSVENWLKAGLSLDEMLALIPAAMRPGIQDKWRYYAGCCWARIRQLHERAREILAGEDPSAAQAQAAPSDVVAALLNGWSWPHDVEKVT